MGEGLLDPAAESREQDYGLEALLVHRRQPGIPVLIRGTERLHLHDGAGVGPGRDLTSEHEIKTTRHDDGIEGWVRYELQELAISEKRGPPAVLDDLDTAA